MNDWESLRENAKKSGIRVVNYERTPIQMLETSWEAIKTKERLEKQGVGIPKYTKAQRKKIKEDVKNYFNLLNEEYGLK